MQTFADVIARWPTVALFATEVGALERTAMSWLQRNSIPADWFAPVARAAMARGFNDISTDRLAIIAEQRRIIKDAARQSQAA